MNEFQPPSRGRSAAAEKLSHKVARELIHDVALAGWHQGMLLGTERDLLQSSGVSRATLREAIRLLEAQGMVTMRQGVGLEVAASARDAVIATLAKFIQISGATPAEVSDARSLIAGHVGASTSQIELCLLVPGLKDILSDRDEVDRLRQWYHCITASLSDPSQSPLLALFLDVLAYSAAGQEDSEGAGSRKLGQMTASVIQRDIETVPRDTRLGTEADFAAKYGVSRVTMREALSLLEISGTLERRRGIGGGLFKGQADASLTVEMAVSYLRFLHPTSDDVAHARLAIEPGLATMTSRSITTQQKEMLRALLHIEEEPGLYRAESARQFHIMLADFGENRVLALFVRVLMSAWSNFPRSDRGADFHDEIYHSHVRICEAIEGNGSNAFAAMVAHLEFADRSMREGKIFL